MFVLAMEMFYPMWPCADVDFRSAHASAIHQANERSEFQIFSPAGIHDLVVFRIRTLHIR